MQAQAFFDVDIRVFRSYLEGYAVSFQAWYGDEVTVELAPPPEELKNLALDPRRYGILMFNWLFKDRLADAFLKARKTAGVSADATFSSTEGSIRLRLCLDGVAPQLARLPWEVLQGPDDYLPLSLSTAFSRFTRVRARSTTPSIERPLRMLQIFVNPADLHAYALPPLDPALAQLTDRLGGAVGSLIVIDRLEEPVTLEAIQDRLKRGYHMVYAVAQTLIDDRLYVLLADDSGNARRVSEDEISAALGSSSVALPQLVILATPLTRREDAGSMQAALALRLLETGIQSVLASEIPQEYQKLQRFNESFFRGLAQTGVIDVAVAQARAEIYDPYSWDWSYPVLVMRSRESQLFQPLNLSMQQQIDTIGEGAASIGVTISSLG